MWTRQVTRKGEKGLLAAWLTGGRGRWGPCGHWSLGWERGNWGGKATFWSLGGIRSVHSGCAGWCHVKRINTHSTGQNTSHSLHGIASVGRGESKVAIRRSTSIGRVLTTNESCLGKSAASLACDGMSLCILSVSPCRRLSEIVASKLGPVDKEKDDSEEEEKWAEGGKDGGGGEFGEAMGTLAPGEMIKRPLLRIYAAYLRNHFGGRELSSQEIGGGTAAATSMGGGEGGGGGGVGGGVWGSDLLLDAAGVGAGEVVSFLVGPRCSVPPHGNGGFPLHAACKGGHVTCVQALLEAGASPNGADAMKRTPLHFAAQGGGVGVVEVLLAAKGSAGARDADRQSVLHHAARGGASRSALELLVKAMGKDKDKPREKGAGGMLEWKDAWGRTALHWAVINGHATVVAWLLGEGASKELRDAAGETALEMAERRARCGASERGDGERASTWANIATVLGGSGTTKNLKTKGFYEKS